MAVKRRDHGSTSSPPQRLAALQGARRSEDGDELAPQDSDKLATYRAKRYESKTPEPFESIEGLERPRLFVCQKHSARALHWDLRIEIGGALKSWAVPKGPSDDPHDKRMAVLTEDHPLEYSDFEGIIPQGNYGAGAMIVWDRGAYRPVPPHDEMERGLEEGKLLFDLFGYKLRGRWTLVKLKKEPKGWLLIKERDEWAKASGDAGLPQESILSGLTVEELKEGVDRGERVRAWIDEWKVPTRAVDPANLEVMKAETRERPFSRKGWRFELKIDGYRLLAARTSQGPRLFYRSGLDATRTFPEIARALAALPFGDLILDGEVAVLDPSGRPSFSRLQKRGLLTGKLECERAAVLHPATLFAFDLLSFEGHDLRSLPLVRRKQALAELLPPRGPLRLLEDTPERGEDLYAAVSNLGLEGIVAKREDSPYRAGRSADWVKVRVDRTGDLAVVGWKESEKRGRPGFSGLHLAVRDSESSADFRYAGSVGTGMTTKQLNDLRAALEPLRLDENEKPALLGTLPKSGKHVWVEPKLVVEVRFKEWTADGHLRHPVFLRTRFDKRPDECVREVEATAFDRANETSSSNDDHDEPARTSPQTTRSTPRSLVFTNLDKVFWPDDGYTKGDLLTYYREIAPWLLPYLKDRPLVLDRYPDGIEGKSFFQKNAPHAPSWMRTATIWGDQGTRELEYVLCDDVDGLLYLANLATIPLHLWASRLTSLDRPDWCILDLDPKGAPFENVIEIALALRALCHDLDLEPAIKTSGGEGMHVVLPLGARYSHDQSRQLAELLANLMVAELPKITTVERNVAARRGRVYIDYLQNGRGKLLVSPFCVRPRPHAPVSTPLDWSEVGPKLDPQKFTLATVPKRMKRRAKAKKGDPFASVLGPGIDLEATLTKLVARMG